jgi:hypothetical protein
VPRFEIRWSHLESRTPQARPFGVLFRGDGGRILGGLTVDGADLLFYEQFRTAVLRLLGVLFTEPAADSAADAQSAWLDVLSDALPPARIDRVEPVDVQDERFGVHHRFALRLEDVAEPALLDAELLLDYQLCQAAIAHQSGRLLRDREVESVADTQERRRLWVTRLRGLMQPPPRPDLDAAVWR